MDNHEPHPEPPAADAVTPGPTDPMEADGGRRPMTRTAAFVAMGIVATAILLLVMLTPGRDTRPEATDAGAVMPEGAPAGAIGPGSMPADAPVPGETAGDAHAGEAADNGAAGKAARLDFTLKDMNGVDVKLASFKGKIILLNFWATWCGPCRAEIPDLVALQNDYGKDLVVLGLSVDDPIEKLKPYATQFKINYPVLVGDGREDVQDAFGPLLGIPVSVIIGRDGVIARKHIGIGSREQFEQEIKALL